jgi:hypothetical protein
MKGAILCEQGNIHDSRMVTAAFPTACKALRPPIPFPSALRAYTRLRIHRRLWQSGLAQRNFSDHRGDDTPSEVFRGVVASSYEELGGETVSDFSGAELLGLFA